MLRHLYNILCYSLKTCSTKLFLFSLLLYFICTAGSEEVSKIASVGSLSGWTLWSVFMVVVCSLILLRKALGRWKKFFLNAITCGIRGNLLITTWLNKFPLMFFSHPFIMYRDSLYIFEWWYPIHPLIFVVRRFFFLRGGRLLKFL